MIQPGELYRAKLPQIPRHPVLVISRELLNRGNQVVVAMLTSTRFEERRGQPNCVPLEAGSCGITKDCVVHAQAIFSLELSDLDLDDGPFGIVDDETMRDVIRALGYVFDADCEPT